MHTLMVVDSEAKTPLSEDLRTKVQDVLRQNGHDLETVETGSRDVVPCLGCLRCHTEKERHGACVNTDAISDVNRRIGDFDLLCYFGPIIFGQFSSTMKTWMDKARAWEMLRSRHLIAIGYGTDVHDDELTTFLDIIRKHQGEAEILHPRFPARFEVFASRSIDDNEELCERMRKSL